MGSSATRRLAVGSSLTGTVQDGGVDTIRIELTAGRTYDLRLHGVGVDAAADVALVLRGPTGRIVAANDGVGAAVWGYGSTTSARLRVEATTGGTYTVEVASAGDGDYLVTAAVHDPRGMVFTPDEIAWQLTNNFWDYALPGEDFTSAFDIGRDRIITVDTDPLASVGRTLAKAALAMWGDVMGVRFVEAGSNADIRFEDDDPYGRVTAYAGPTAQDGVISYSTVMVSKGWLTHFGSDYASYGFETYVHEIGHALGLGHAGNYNGSATYGRDNYYQNDSLANSIMSYMQVAGDEFGDANTSVPANFRHMLTPAVADILAVQTLYGSDTATRTGDTTYGFGSNTGNTVLDRAVSIGADMFMAVYDDGGTDRLDFSRTGADQTITLTATRASSVLGGRMNLQIARDSVIENADGGRGDDRMSGNAVRNALAGNAGTDTLSGAAGNDTLSGGSGEDVLSGDAGDDAVWGGTGADRITGGPGDDHLRGDVSADRLAGGPDDDTLVGGSQNDTLGGDTGDDSLSGGTGHDRVKGDGGRDTLAGDSGDDALFGGSGSDRIAGGTGRDLIETGGGADIVVFAPGDGRDVVGDFANGGDRLDLAGFDLGAFSDIRARASSGNLLIDFGDGDVLVLQTFALRLLDRADVIL